MTTPDYDAIVLGAGAAGLMCAAVAGQRGRRVLLLDHAEQVGKKILISGGGRCNFTNIHTAPDRYISANPHFAKSALARYTPADFIALVDAYGIAHHEKTLGQLFCDGSAKQIVAMLLEECAKGDVDIRCGQPVRAVTHADGVFSVAFGDRPVRAPNLVIATGGPSIPKMGATGFAYDLARQFGLKIVEPRPALVPLTLGGDDVLFRDLSGVATPVEASAGKAAFREAALFTHKGLSGPAILQISSYWRSGDPVTIDFLPAAEPGVGTAIDEIARRHGDYALVGVVARIRVVDGLVTEAHMTYVSAGELGQVVDYTNVLAGASATDQRDPRWRTLGECARAQIDTEADIHGTAAYRSQLVSALTARVGFAAATDALSENAVLAGKW